MCISQTSIQQLLRYGLIGIFQEEDVLTVGNPQLRLCVCGDVGGFKIYGLATTNRAVNISMHRVWHASTLQAPNCLCRPSISSHFTTGLSPYPRDGELVPSTRLHQATTSIPSEA
jgi:hypothetical protein